MRRRNGARRDEPEVLEEEEIKVSYRAVSCLENEDCGVVANDDGTVSRPEVRSLVLVVWQRWVVPGKILNVRGILQ